MRESQGKDETTDKKKTEGVYRRGEGLKTVTVWSPESGVWKSEEVNVRKKFSTVDQGKEVLFKRVLRSQN